MLAQKKGAPPVGLFLTLDLNRENAGLTQLKQFFFVVNRSDYEKNMHIVELITGDKTSQSDVEEIVSLIQQNGLVALIRDNYALAMQVDADGVILSDASQMSVVKNAVGDDFIIGLNYNIFEDMPPLKDLIEALDCIIFDAKVAQKYNAEWLKHSQNPIILQGDIDNKNAAFYVHMGATFLDATDYILNHPKDAMQATVNMLFAIEQTSPSTELN